MADDWEVVGDAAEDRPTYPWADAPEGEWQAGPDQDLEQLGYRYGELEAQSPGEIGKNTPAPASTQDGWETVGDQELAPDGLPTQTEATAENGQVWEESPVKPLTQNEPLRGPAKRLQEIVVSARRPTMADKIDPNAINVTEPGHYEWRQGRGGRGRFWVPDKTDAEGWKGLKTLPGEIGTQAAMRVGGAKEFFGQEGIPVVYEHGVQQEHKRLWQALVLPRIVREWTAFNLAQEDPRDRINMDEWPEAVAIAERLGIRPGNFTREWPEFVNKGPEELAQIYKDSVEGLRVARERRAEGAALREKAGALSAAYRPRNEQWSPPGLVFDMATSVPDLLAASGATMVGGPGAGLATMTAAVAPQYYAEGRNMGLPHAKATGYASLMSMAEVAPELPVLEAIARTPAAKQAMARMLGGFAESRTGQVVGTAALESSSEMITEALQIAIENGQLDQNTTLPEALKQIARAGVIGAGPGATIGAITARGGQTSLQPGRQGTENRPQPGQEAANAVPAEEVVGAVEPGGGEWEVVDGADAGGTQPGDVGADRGGDAAAGPVPVGGEPGQDAGRAEQGGPEAVRDPSGEVPGTPDVQPGEPVAEVAGQEFDARLADEGYRAGLEGFRRDIGQFQKQGQVRLDSETGEFLDRSEDISSEFWKGRPVFDGPRGGQRRINAAVANDALDKVAAGRENELTDIQKQFVQYALDESEINRKAWEAHQIEQAQRHEDEIRDVVPDFDQQSEIDQDLTMLAKVAAQHATQDEVEAALEAQDDAEAIRRLQTLIDRGWQERPQSEGEANGEAEDSGQLEPEPAAPADAGANAGAPEPAADAGGGQVDVSSDQAGELTAADVLATEASDTREASGSATAVSPLEGAEGTSDTPSAPLSRPGSDLFGADLANTEALNKKNAKVARKLGEGRAAPPADKAPKGDMFREAADAERAAAEAAQTDIEQAPPAEAAKPEKLELKSKKKGWQGVPDAEIEIMPVDGGFVQRNAANGPRGGHGGPFSDKVHATRADAIRAGADYIRSRLTNKEQEPHNERVRKWLDEISPLPRTDNIGAAADSAATSPTNALPEPTPAQKDAGNYAKGHISLHGLDIGIENPKGSFRWKLDTDALEEVAKAARLEKAAAGIEQAQANLGHNSTIPSAFAQLMHEEDRLAKTHPKIGKKLSQALDKSWFARLAADYGYIKGHVGADKDHLDVYVGTPALAEDPKNPVFVMDQQKAGGGFDEHKVFMGYRSEAAARADFVASFDDPKFANSITAPMVRFESANAFKQWLATGDLKKPVGEWARVQRPEQTTERPGGEPAAADAVVPKPVPSEERPTESSGARSDGVRAGAGKESATPSGNELPDGLPATGGERANQQVRADAGSGTAQPAAGSDDAGSGADAGRTGTSDDLFGASDPVAAAERAAPSVDRAEKARRQKAAEPIKVVPTDPKNIAATLPFLLEGQHDDVRKAEERFAKPDGYGMLFTNGTGTGKTYSGLGIVKRFVKQGKKNGIVVVPSQKVADDWINSAKDLGLNIELLEDTKDPGKGINVTTFANFLANATLADRPYDWAVVDEAHSLMQNAAAEDTSALDALRAITLHPDGWHRRAQMIHRAVWEPLQEVRAQIKALEKLDQHVPEALSAREESLTNQFNELAKPVGEFVKANQLEKRPRVVFLSATPFAYEKNVRWANGYLFDWGSDDQSQGYNKPGEEGYKAFMIRHFGYRMRYNKLTEPDPKVDRTVMQRQFNTWMQKQGTLSARVLDEPYDYDRKFVLVDSQIGNKIDEGLEWLRGQKDLHELTTAIEKRFDHLSKARLLEALKAREAVPYIKAQLALGRKVVIFYDYNEGGGFNVFDVSAQAMGSLNRDGSDSPQLRQQAIKFMEQRPDLVELNTQAPSPLQTLMKAFPRARQYNGLIPAKVRIQSIKDFNDDAKPDVNLILAQKAANAGWSAHDTSGKFPRVLINLGLPTAPTVAIQQEGRIYRVGQASDAMFRYFNTGTSWERYAFATTIARRASTAENLAMGEKARGLLDSFVEAFQDSSHDEPGGENDGKGGKARDRALASELTPFDRAKTFYFSQRKRTSRDKSEEGNDYFATPEPLGYKMVEWAGIKPEDQLLEPSAGHGAIARFFPETNTRTVIEPSPKLSSRLALNTDAKLIRENFEDLNPVNKYDAIVMNPPFGHGGSTAIEHLDKAFNKHLRQGGRIVALIPEGPSADKKFQNWFEAQQGAHIMAEYGLPTVTFERAGTSVKARIVIIDKLDSTDILRKAYDFNEYRLGQQRTRREIDAESIGDFFERIKEVGAPERVANVTLEERKRRDEELVRAEERKVAQKEEKKAAAKSGKAFTAVDSKHTKYGYDIFYAVPVKRQGDDTYQSWKRSAAALEGSYSSWGATKGFLFRSRENRDAFMHEWNGETTTGAARVIAGQKAKTPVPPAAAEAHIEKISKVLKGVDIYPINGFADIPLDEVGLYNWFQENHIGEDDFYGVMWSDGSGKRVIYLNTRTFDSLSDIEKTLWHEATHRGFRSALGDKPYNTLLDHLFVQNGGTSGFKREVRDYFTSLDRKFDVNNPEHRRIVVDEALADVAERLSRGETLADRAAQLFERFMALISKFLRNAGWRRTFSKAEIYNAVRSAGNVGMTSSTATPDAKTPLHEMAEFATKVRKEVTQRSAPTTEVALSLKREGEEITEATSKFWESIKKGQYVERAIRMGFRAVPGMQVNAKGEWQPSPLGRRVAKKAADSALTIGKHAMGFMRPLGERVNRDIVKEYGLDTKASEAWEAVKSGFIDRYNTPADFVTAESAAKNYGTQVLDRAKRMVADLEKSGVVSNRAEAEALQAILTGESVGVVDARMAAVSEPIRQTIDQWGQEAVELGLLDKATFERNRATYLHRVYRKHEADWLGAGKMVKAVDDAMTRHRRRIIGNQFKRRGISQDVSLAALHRAAPAEWWGRKTDGKKIDVALGDSDWLMLSKISNPRENTPDAFDGTVDGKPKVVDRIYWPADVPVPAKFAGWRNDGTFRAIKVTPTSVTLWRDFTKDERMKMGEILDMRYTFLKTALTAAHDLSTGRLFKQIADNPEWSRDTAPQLQDGTPLFVDADPSKRKTYGGIEWVRVPDTNVPGTQVKRYGAMSGKYIRSAIWRDLNEVEMGMKPGVWKAILTQFKKNKTTRNPKTHIFNTMSNVILAYIDDMRASDWVRGLKDWYNEGPMWEEARLHGVFGHDFIDQEVRRDILKPLLEKILAESALDGTEGKKLKLLTRVFSGIKRADEAATWAYQAEDEIFRMASYMQARKQGMSPDEAAIHARRQFIDYDIRAPYINALRYSVIPFISYPYRAIPRVMEAVAKRPWKVATLALLTYALNMIAYELMDDDDEDLQRRLMNENLRGHTWAMTPRMLRLPMNDEYGNPVFLDLRNGLPAANIVDLENSYSVVPTPAWMQIGGPLVIGVDAMQNYNAYRQEPIADREVDTFGQKVAKGGAFIWSSYMPSWAPGGYAWDKVSKAVEGRMNQAHETSTIGMAVAQSVLPIRVESTDKNYHDRVREYERKLRALSEQQNDLTRGFNQIKAPDNDDRADLREALQEIESRRQQVLREMKDTLQGEQ